MSAEKVPLTDKVVVPMPSATVTIVRNAGPGVEVLMMKRNLQSGFVPGMHVFPGGGLDDDDLLFKNNSLCNCLNDGVASATLGLAQDGLCYWIAAIREAFEESGLLLARHAQGGLIRLDDDATSRRFAEHRRRLNAGEASFTSILREEGLEAAADTLTYFAHWITPVRMPRRYDTRFFMAEAPEGQHPVQDERETIAATWIKPAEALSLHCKGEFEMRTPTVRTLETFADFDSVASLRAGLVEKQGEIRAVLPKIGKDGARILPGEPGYEEASAEGRVA